MQKLLAADPEAAWPGVRSFLCESARRHADEQSDQRVMLIEELMYRDADAFIGRLEAVLEDCAELRQDVVQTYVGGIAVGPGLARYYELHDRLSHEFEAEGLMVSDPPTPRPRSLG